MTIYTCLADLQEYVVAKQSALPGLKNTKLMFLFSKFKFRRYNPAANKTTEKTIGSHARIFLRPESKINN